MRYFFNVQDGDVIPDLFGTDLADDEAAKAEALSSFAEMAGDLGRKFWDGGEWQMNVQDETGRKVLTLRFSGEISAALA